MSAIKNRLISLLIVSFIGGAAVMLTPEGGARRTVKLLSAIMIFFSFLSLFKSVPFSFSKDSFSDYESEARLSLAEGKAALENELLAGIRENCKKTALEKAADLSLSVEIDIIAAFHEERGYITESCVVRYTVPPEEDAVAAFRRWLNEELGIPPKRQRHITVP